MPISIRDGVIWKESEPWIRDGVIWKPVQQGFVNDGGVWKEFYSASASPFLATGSWENSSQGWTNVEGIVFGSTAGRARTGIYYIGNSATNSLSRLMYEMDMEETKGLTITASVWTRTTFGYQSTEAILTISEIGGASQTANVDNTSTTYQLLSVSLDAKGIGGVEVTLQLRSGTIEHRVADDWTIQGVRS